MRYRHLTAAVLAFGVLAAPASAGQRLFAVTLTNGQRYLVPIEADPATPVDQLTFPQMEAPIASVQELPAATPTPTDTPGPTGPSGTAGPTGTLAPTATATGTPTAAATSAMQGPTVTRADRRRVTRALGKLESVDGDGAKKPGKKEKAADTLAPLPSTGFGGGFVPLHLPNFFIDHFSIPPFLLPIYQAAGVQYGVRWEVLAAINSIETNYGRNLNVSSAGAVGWMQFMPSTWKQWGVDANRDGRKDPYNPVDAIFAAARYLKAAGAGDNLRRAIFAYNHAGWYVDDVMLRARTLSGLPPALIAGLTGLTEGRFPVPGKATSVREPDGRSALIHARSGAPVFAVTDGVVVRRSKTSITLRDAYGNAFVYGGLGAVAKRVSPPPAIEVDAPAARQPLSTAAAPAAGAAPATTTAPTTTAAVPAQKVRLFANHRTPAAPARPAAAKAHPLLPGRRVVAGSVLGSLLAAREGRSQMRFAIRPGGKHAPRIDPTPILRGWRLLDQTKIHRATDARDGDPSVGQVLLMGKGELARMVLADPGISIYACGRRDIRYGLIDRRVLATLEILRLSHLDPTVSALECGHSRLTTSGNVSEHWVGQAVDISAINGTPIAGHQGPGTITETTIDRLLDLQGAMTPHQIISLMALPQAGNTLSMEDHADHIHVGFAAASSKIGRADARGLKRGQWARLVARLGEIKNPVILR